MNLKLPLVLFLAVFFSFIAMAQTFFRDKIELSLSAKAHVALGQLDNIDASNITLDFDGPYGELKGEFHNEASRKIVVETLSNLPEIRSISDFTQISERVE